MAAAANTQTPNLLDRILANMVTGPSGDKARADSLADAESKKCGKKRKGEKL